MTDWSSEPNTAQTHANELASTKARDDSNAKMDYSGDTNIPDGTIRWNQGSARFEMWDASGGSWGPLPKLQMDVDQVDGIDLPNTIANVLTDHDKAAHDALAINADKVDGIDFPATIAQALTDHNKALHDALNIDAASLQGVTLASNGGAIPELDRSNTFTQDQVIAARLLLLAFGSQGGEQRLGADPSDLNQSPYRIWVDGPELRFARLDGSLASIIFNEAELVSAGEAAQGPGTLNFGGVFVDGDPVDDVQESSPVPFPGVPGPTSVAHGLGTPPRYSFVRIVNKSAEHGYSVGDETDLVIEDSAGESSRIPVSADNNNLEVNTDAAFKLVIDRSSGGFADYVAITENAWDIVFRWIP